MASNITLSSSVRQNLLSLQATADLMSTTQNRLATGKKVNSALDNPSNFFTSQALNNRASDLNSLLDSIGQAQQTLKAADQGITSLTKLVSPPSRSPSRPSRRRRRDLCSRDQRHADVDDTLVNGLSGTLTVQVGSGAASRSTCRP